MKENKNRPPLKTYYRSTLFTSEVDVRMRVTLIAYVIQTWAMTNFWTNFFSFHRWHNLIFDVIFISQKQKHILKKIMTGSVTEY